MDREKIIRILEKCAKGPLRRNADKYVIMLDVRFVNSILELLKEQEAKTGHWIESAGDDKFSVCGATYGDLYPDYQYTHYCQNCGARMIF